MQFGVGMRDGKGTLHGFNVILQIIIEPCPGSGTAIINNHRFSPVANQI
jgi:hypothetical protein